MRAARSASLSSRPFRILLRQLKFMIAKPVKMMMSTKSNRVSAPKMSSLLQLVVQELKKRRWKRPRQLKRTI